MDIVVSLCDINHLNRLKDSGISGIIFGSLFTNKYNFTISEMSQINEYCKENNLKRYISIDAFISEDDKTELYEYFEIIKSINPDGIYFSDLCIFNVAKGYDLLNKLIYNPDTLMTNSLDIAFYLQHGIDVTLSSELCLEEILNIIKKFPGRLDMQIFGHQRLSQSKRKFLSNYFHEINKDIEFINQNDMTIVEESRSYNLPIKETKNGTSIYSDFILLIYDELANISPLINRGIVDTSFIDPKVLFDVLGDLKRLNKDNASFMKNTLINKYPNYIFSEGYFYNKTVDKKDE